MSHEPTFDPWKIILVAFCVNCIVFKFTTRRSSLLELAVCAVIVLVGTAVSAGTFLWFYSPKRQAARRARIEAEAEALVRNFGR